MKRHLVPAVAALAALALLGCSSGSLGADAKLDDTVPDPPVCQPDGSADGVPACWAVGRLVTRTGCSDTHCERDGGTLSRMADYAACGIAAPAPVPWTSTGLGDAAGSTAINDDLCEFHAIVVPICAGAGRGLFFDVELSTMDGEVVPPGAAPYAEAFSSPVHPAPSTGDGVELATGRYRIGPVVFDVPGYWTVTLHFFGTCRDDLAASPHAHVTLNLQVP
jgi:hypothetical protein